MSKQDEEEQFPERKTRTSSCEETDRVAQSDEC